MKFDSELYRQANYWDATYHPANSGAGERYPHLHISKGGRSCVVTVTSNPEIRKGEENFSRKEKQEILKIASEFYYSNRFYYKKSSISNFKEKLEIMKRYLINYKNYNQEIETKEKIKHK